jgi:hypothetical protein
MGNQARNKRSNRRLTNRYGPVLPGIDIAAKERFAGKILYTFSNCILQFSLSA